MTTKELTSAPNTLEFMAKAALPVLPGASLLPGLRKAGAKGTLPELVLVRRGVAIDPAHVAAYAEICGFPHKDTVPLPYPHMLAFGLHMALMTDAAFPFPAIGTVHLENSITSHRPLGLAEVVDIAVHAENLRGHAKGHVYDVVTKVTVGAELVWEETCTFLVRGRGDADAPSGLELDAVAPGPVTWKLPADLGRRYGTVSGDRNPIHLYALTAKAFGFPRQIAHGMWSMARCVAMLENRLAASSRVDVAFKTPILLPGTVNFGSAVDADGARFTLSNPKSGAPHVVGQIVNL